MLTYEDVTGYFLKAATTCNLMTHQEYWMNARSLEREFACTCHTGTCSQAEQHSSCTISFTWGPLDTALSLEGPVGVCEFFHETDSNCLHLHTSSIPPLVLDLSYTLPLNGLMLQEETMLSLTQMLKLRASEHSKLTIETRPGVNMVLQDNRLQPESLTLQQRIEIPIWHPEGMRGLHDTMSSSHSEHRLRDEENEEVVADDPHPEEWLPQVMVEVCQDIVHVLEALELAVSSTER